TLSSLPVLTPAPEPSRSRISLLNLLGKFAAVLLVLVTLGWWLVTISVPVVTEKPMLVVEVTDSETKARLKNGKLILTGTDDRVSYTFHLSEGSKWTIKPGHYRIRLEGADGLVLDKPEFTAPIGGQATVRVMVDPRALVNNPDPNRKAAEYVLSLS